MDRTISLATHLAYTLDVDGDFQRRIEEIQAVLDEVYSAGVHSGLERAAGIADKPTAQGIRQLQDEFLARDRSSGPSEFEGDALFEARVKAYVDVGVVSGLNPFDEVRLRLQSALAVKASPGYTPTPPELIKLPYEAAP